jgi:hypothetical protein
VAFLIRFLFVAAAIYFFSRLLAGLRAFGAAVTGKNRGAGAQRAKNASQTDQRSGSDASSGPAKRQFNFKENDVMDVSYQPIEEEPQRDKRETVASEME